MARYRKIDPRIWNDAKFAALSDRAKLVFFMLLTHPNMTAIGAMRGTAPGLAAELGWGLEAFAEAFREVLAKGMAEHDERACLIALPKFIQYNQPESPNVVKAWLGALDLLPECGLKTRVVARAKGYAEALPDGFTKALPEAFAKGMPIPEPEQEPEPKEDQKIPPAVPAVVPADPIKKPKAKRPPTLTDWLASLDGADAIPENDPVYAYAERTGIPDEFLALSWASFKDAYTASGKRQKDFPATYRNAVKGNWYKLWWFDTANGGECRLTTAGEQARRAAE